jgi:nicotinate-nucleotide adenylyltransferase
MEKIMYMADYIEPTRDFEGVEELRNLAFADIDSAIIKGLEMSMDDLSERGIEPHIRSVEALAFLRQRLD